MKTCWYIITFIAMLPMHCIGMLENDPVANLIQELDQYSLEGIFLHDNELTKNKHATSRTLQQYLSQSNALLRNDRFKFYLEQRCKQVQTAYLQEVYRKYQPYKIKLWNILSKKLHDKTISPDQLVEFLGCINDFEMILLNAKIEGLFDDKNSKIRRLKSALYCNKIITVCISLLAIGYVYATYPSKEKKQSKPITQKRRYYDRKKASRKVYTP